jgi:hypothetical protein
MHHYVKEIINRLIYDKDICKPIKIFNKLSKRKYKKKFQQKIDRPTLPQLQNYVKYIREKIGHSNKVSDLIKFDAENQYYDDIEEDKLFTFGGSFGDGSDESHFHLGIILRSKNFLKLYRIFLFFVFFRFHYQKPFEET